MFSFEKYFVFKDSNDKPTDKHNLRKTFERAEVIGQWLGEIERNVETIKQMICRLDDISLNHIGK